MYVYVDEDGVEHEISAEEAAQYEVVEGRAHRRAGERAGGRGPRAPDSEPDAADDEPATYFWVDEHGIEHEVSADELHEFELYDEDES